MKVGDIVRRKTTDKTFVGSYYCIVEVGVKHVYALKLNSADDNPYVLKKHDFCKVPILKIRVANKIHNSIESLKNNTCKTIKHVLSKQWENVIDINPHIICIVNNVGQKPMYFIYKSGEKVVRHTVEYTSTGVLTTRTHMIKITLGHRIL
jgi:hypothetical protein